VAVILFHAGIPGFSGGFVGVDVFFVISGRLITAIIAREIAGGEFSVAVFFLRKARTAYPAWAVFLSWSGSRARDLALSAAFPQAVRAIARRARRVRVEHPVLPAHRLFQ
jgi:peptidoglycan/LPS O-acetylase OafA/YrhL